MFDFPSSPTEGQEYAPAGGPTYVFNAPRWLPKTSFQGRILATLPIVYYISPTGLDTNSGLSAATPIKTLARAWEMLRDLDITRVSVTWNLADGTYTESLAPPTAQTPLSVNPHMTYPSFGAAGIITVAGNAASPSSVVIAYGVSLRARLSLFIQGVTFGVPYNGVTVDEGTIQIDKCRIGNGGLSSIGNDSRIITSSSLEINQTSGQGGGPYIKALSGGFIRLGTNTAISFPATGVSCNGGFAQVNDGTIQVDYGVAFTVGQQPVGPKFVAENRGAIKVHDGNLDIFPGTLPGTFDANAVYFGNSPNNGGLIGPGGALVADTPPTWPKRGALWWQSSTGNLYIYYDDGSSKQWVQINSVGT